MPALLPRLPGRGRWSGAGCAAARAAAATRIVSHPELFDLTIAHIDCDAFYASVEKRDRPELAAQPVIVGGGVRGVVTAACYVARIYGVRSAMPMFKALKACPDAVVIRPDFAKYVAVGRQIRAHDGDADAAAAAAVDRRGGARPRRHRGAARRAARRRAGPLRPRGGSERRRHRLDRPGRQPAAGQDRRRPRQAARLRGDRRRGGRVAAGAGAGPPAARHRSRRWPGGSPPRASRCSATCRR